MDFFREVLRTDRKIVSFDRKRYTGTGNNVQLLGSLRLEKLISFPIPSTDRKSAGSPFMLFYRGQTLLDF